LQSGCDEKGICNPQQKARANGEGLQIPLFKAAGLQIRPNGKLHAGHNFVYGQWTMDNGKLIINYQLSIINCAKGAVTPELLK